MMRDEEVDFQSIAYGKWILAGEHAVLRGCPALVFPVYGKKMTLQYRMSDEELSIDLRGHAKAELQFLFGGVIERALEKVGQSRSQLKGSIYMENDIPIGAGLGASAAFCVNITRWFEWLGWIEEEDVYEFSRSLEDLFHGESSGVDIAVALSGQGMHFEREGKRESLELKWKPTWYLQYSGERGITSECVNKVKELFKENESQAKAIDGKMLESVKLAEQALMLDEREGFSLLVEAIEKAASCFDAWGLTGGEMGEKIKWLKAQGAAAVKPTGSGNGGYILSLWRERPSEGILKELVSIH